MKTIRTVLIEAFCIGLIFAVMMYLSMLFIPIEIKWLVLVSFICGAAFHLICQVTGVNDWYVRTYED